MVASTDRYASEVGVAVLRGGGNAVDAAVATAFALAVVNPEAGNLGGSGFLVVRARSGEVTVLDFRSTAPAGAGRESWPGARPEASLLGHRAVAVPGSVMGLWEAHRRHGALPWGALIQPAVGLARGFRVGKRFLRSFDPETRDGLARFPSSARIFLSGGQPPPLGAVFVQSDLAETLERVRDGGAEGFYRGETARRIAEEMRRGGGFLTEDDLSAYRTIWRDPVRVEYRGHALYTVPPPSSGGVTLAETAHILEGWPLGDAPWHGEDHVHRLAESWKRAFADRHRYLGDPDFVEVPTETLTSAEYGRNRASGIFPGRATPSALVEPGRIAPAPPRGASSSAARGAPPEGNHTTHLSVVGPDGDAASLTTTLNTWYGSKLVAEGTGVLLNNDMDDFTLEPGKPNYFGLVQGDANRVEAGKRMLSAMSPSIVLDPDGELLMVLGAAGGPTIITTLFQVVSNAIDFGLDAATAVSAPRVHHQHVPDELMYEPGGLPDDVLRRLEGFGHRVKERDELSGDVHAVVVGEHRVLQGVSDPRRGGVAVGF